MKYEDSSIHTTSAGVVVIYNGVHKSTNNNAKHHLFMCNHEALNCIEIFANDPVPSEEGERIYVNAEMVISKLENGVLLEEFDRRMKELLRLNQIHDRSALLKDVTSRLVVNFLLDRIKIREEAPSPTLTIFPPKKRYSLFIEPKPHDAKSPRGKADFEYDAKPAKVTPARIITSSAVLVPSEEDHRHDSKDDDETTQEPIEPIQEEDEDEDDKICEIKSRNQFIQRSRSRSLSTDSHDEVCGGSLLPPVDEWMLREGEEEEDQLNEDRRHSFTEIMIYGSAKLTSEFGEEVPDSLMYQSDSDEEGRNQGEHPAEPTTPSGEHPARKELTRKRSMSESDLYVKAAGLATLNLGCAATEMEATNTEEATAGIGSLGCLSFDDAHLMKPGGSSTKSGKKLLLPLLPSDFKYAKDVPVDVKVPSYLAHTSSNYAKKLPPLRSASPTPGGSSGRLIPPRPSTADCSRPSSSHGGAVGRLHDLKQVNGSGKVTTGTATGTGGSMKKPPHSVTNSGVKEVERGSVRITAK